MFVCFCLSSVVQNDTKFNQILSIQNSKQVTIWEKFSLPLCYEQFRPQFSPVYYLLSLSPCTIKTNEC